MTDDYDDDFHDFDDLDDFEGIMRASEEASKDLFPGDGGDEAEFDPTLFADVFRRELTIFEFQYLLSRFPYIELANTVNNSRIDSLKQAPEPRQTQSGWLLYDKDDYLLAGPGRLRLGGYNGALAEGEDDEDSGGGGTLLWQGIRTVQELMALANARWEGLMILGGHYPLQRYAWMVALDSGLAVEGFQPMVDDINQHAYIHALQQSGPGPNPRR